ncbi:MAG: PRC and DUF2382 domain-containing protein [Chloroflexota bacterium]|nr:PRC and DUF2382 domain-containing protein [Chloroflexota bacterium]
MTRAPLSQLDDWQLVNSDKDLRDKTLMTDDGRMLGTVREMIVNTDTEYVDALVLDDGTEIPMSEVRLDSGTPYYMAAPAAADVDIDTDRTAAYTGLDRTAAYTDTARTAGTTEARDDDITIPVMAEEIRVGKRQVEGGGVRVNTRVEEVPVEKQVTLRDEEIDVHRQKVDRPASESDFNTLQEGSFEIREHDEQPVVDKQARVVEEVVIDKDVTERTEQIQDTVRRSDVDVEQLHERGADRR